MATLRDVARRAGVSVSTVSHVINGYDDIKPSTRRRVLQAIKELDYHPNAMARNLLKRRSHTLGVIIPKPTSLAHPFLNQIIVGLAAAVRESGYAVSLSLVDTGSDVDSCLAEWKESKVEGLIGVGFSEDEAVVQALLESTIPTAFVDTHVTAPHIRSVSSDNEAGSYMAVRHLIGLGHERIAFLGGQPSGRIIRDRYDGYRRALEESGLDVPGELIRVTDFTKESAYRAMRELLQHSRPRPTAVFCVSDLIAFGAMQAARDLRVKTPEELAVVGFDDIEAAKHVTPPLSTVKQDGYKMGETAVDSLVSMISSPKKVAVEPVLLPVELVVRASCGGRVGAVEAGA